MFSKIPILVALLCFAFRCGFSADTPPLANQPEANHPAETKERDPDKNSGNLQIHFENTNLTFVLAYYERISRKTVWLRVGVDATVKVSTRDHLSQTDACKFVEDTLLTKYGIEMKPSNDNAILVDWSDEQKLKMRRETEGDDKGGRVPNIKLLSK